MRKLGVVCLLVVASSIVLTSCGGKIRSEVVAACMRGGGPKENCTCFYKKLEDKYGISTLEAMRDHRLAPPDFGQSVVASAAECSGLDSAVAMEILGVDPRSTPSVVPIDPEAPSTPVQPGERPSAPEFASDEATIDAAIAVTGGVESGEEFREGRKTASGDVDGNGVLSDRAVLFTIEVGSQNLSTQYLAVFLRQDNGSLRFASATPVGGRGNIVDDLVIEHEEIRLSTLELGPDDPDCCPTLERQISYVLHNGKVKRVN